MKTNRSSVARAAFACAVLLSIVTSSSAADLYATPDGAGVKDGSGWSNAYDKSQIPSAANALTPGDTLRLGSGTYNSVSLTLTSSGAAGQPKSIVGVDTGGGLPLMLGAWSELTPATAPAGSSYLIRFSGTVSHWVIKDLRVKKYAVALTEVSAGTYSNLTIDNLDADTVRDGITLVSVADSVVRNCDIVRHTKKAFRLTEDVRFVTYENCTADATGGDNAFPTEAFPNGFYSAGNSGLHDITFVDCVARNQRMSGQPAASYWNGDGFSSESPNYNYTYLRCKSFDNDDGGFDDKAKNVTYDGCVAIGNKRAFRYWGSSAIMVNCLGAYSKSWGDIDPANSASMPAYSLWVAGQINVSQSTFHNGVDAQVHVEPGAQAVLNDCILSVDGTFSNGAMTDGSVVLNRTKQFKPGAGLDADPAYVSASRTWTGSPANAFDSQTYASPEKGYFQSSGTANRPPSLSFTALPATQHMVPFTIALTPTATDSDGTIASYAWNSGDGATSSSAAPSFTYANAGVYTLTCTVTDNSGAVAVRTISVRGIEPNAGPDHYVTPTGAGNLDGSSWSNAYSQAELQALANSLYPGDTIHLGSGTYTNTTFALSQSGTASAPILIHGVDTGAGLPVFDGTFDTDNSASGSFMSFGTGAMAYITIKDLNFRDIGFVVDMPQTGPTDTLRHHITFENLSFDSIEDALRIRNASNVLVKNCHAIRYTKKAFRIGDYTSFITVRDSSADCNGGDDSFPARAIPNGFFCDNTDGQPIIHDIVFIDCVARNNRFAQDSDSYWNGDGFSSESGAYNISFIRCGSYDNHDGGFDNKSYNVLYVDCISAGNSRGYRQWGPAGQMINSVAAFNTKWGGSGSTYGMWVGGSLGEITITSSTIHQSGAAVYTEAGGKAKVVNSILSTNSATAAFTIGAVTLVDTATWRPGQGTDPVYGTIDSTWRGSPLTAINSQTYGTAKGFNTANIDTSPNALPTVSLGVSATQGQAPLTVFFTAAGNDPDGSVASYEWRFGNGQTSTAQNPGITYAQPGTYSAICTVTDNRHGRTSAALTITVTPAVTPAAVRIESGSTTAYADGNGRAWAEDHSFVGGSAIDRGAVAIANTTDDRLYQTERSGLSGYAVALANGTYTVNLHLAETSPTITAFGQRVFTVTAEDAIPVGWRNIDIFGQAGGANTALVKSGTITVTDGTLDLGFAATADVPVVSGIEILPATSGDTPPSAPTNLVASAITATTLQLSWTAASDDVGIAGYDVFADGVFNTTTSGTSANVAGLTPYTVYHLTVRARDTVGNRSPSSATFTVRTQADPVAGYEIIMDNTDATGVTLTGNWLSSDYTPGFYGSDYVHDENLGKGTKSVRFTPDLPFGGSITVYLRWTSETNRASNVPVDIIHANGTTTVTVNERNNGGVWFSLGAFTFNAGTAGSVLIRTTGTNGYVMADAVRFVRAAVDLTPPTTPTNLTASNLTTGSFNLSWAASTDNSGVTGYEVLVDGVSRATPATTPATIAGLAPATTYSVTVRAHDAAGNWSAPSAPLAVTTSAPGYDIVVDNADATGVVITGNWPTSTYSPGYYGSNYLHDDNSGKGTKSVRFTPNLPVTGSATVYIRWIASATRATNVPVDIVHANGTATVTVNQRQNGERWVSLGTYDFAAGTAGSVLVRTNGTSGHVIADAARFERISAAPPPSITSAPSASGTYGAPFVYQITATGDPTSFGALDLPAGLSLDPASGVISGVPGVAGDCFVTLCATGPGGACNRPVVLSIARLPQTITLANPTAKTYGDAPVALTATASSGLPVTLAVMSGPAELNGSTVAITGAGNVVIAATQAGDAIFLPATPVSVSFTVARAPQTITFTNPGAKTFGDAPVTLAAQASSGLPVAYTLTSGPATLAGHVLTLTGAGTVHITAAQSGNANFLAAESTSVAFEVASAPAQLALENLWQLYDGETKPVAVTTTPADLPVRVTYNGSATPPVYPGSYAVAAEIDSPDYVGSVNDTLVVATGVVVRHAPVLDGSVRGSVQVLSAESVTLNGGAIVSGDLLSPGTPSTRLNGQPNFGGAVDAPGGAQPSNFIVTLNGNSTLRHLVRRIDAGALPAVSAPPAPAGSRDVALNNATQSPGDFATLRNLTLNGDAGLRAIPPGTYGTFIANGGGGFILGAAGTTEPAVYNLHGLMLNGDAQVQVVGPVVLTLASGVTLNGRIGAAGKPELLLFRIASGGLTLNGGATLDGFVDAPNGTVIINGNSTLTGGLSSDRLTVNGGGVLVEEAP